MSPKPRAAKKRIGTHVARLRKAGILTATQRLPKKHEDKINSLRRSEVDALVRVMKKVGRPGKVHRGRGRSWIIL
jgi:hypothetical protein